MRSGGVVGKVQEEVAWYRKPAPIRHLQPLSQTLRVCQLPLHRGAKPPRGTGFPSEGAKPCGGRKHPSEGAKPCGGGKENALCSESRMPH